MNDSIVVDRHVFIFADGVVFCSVAAWAYEVKIPVHELEGQRGEGLIFGRIWYMYNDSTDGG